MALSCPLAFPNPCWQVRSYGSVGDAPVVSGIMWGRGSGCWEEALKGLECGRGYNALDIVIFRANTIPTYVGLRLLETIVPGNSLSNEQERSFSVTGSAGQSWINAG